MRRVRKTIGDKSIGSKSILIFWGSGVCIEAKKHRGEKHRDEKAWRDK